MRTLFIIVALVASNFVYQWIFRDQPDWSIAIDRSYFQAVAVYIYTLAR